MYFFILTSFFDNFHHCASPSLLIMYFSIKIWTFLKPRGMWDNC